MILCSQDYGRSNELHEYYKNVKKFSIYELKREHQRAVSHEQN